MWVEMDIAMPIAVAMADTRHSVVAVADGVMRRLSGHIDWENAGLVSRLYAIFLGTLTIKGKFETRAEDKKQPANTRYGHLLYSIFYCMKSKQSWSVFRAISDDYFVEMSLTLAAAGIL